MFGVVVLEGLLARHLRVAGGGAIELFGPSDVVNPFAGSEPSMLAIGSTWSAVERSRVAILTPNATDAMARFPSIVAAVARRAGARAERLAVHQAIAQLPRVEQRILTMLWYVAERWGRVNSEGVSVILPLSHGAVGQLVGARRPTVSLAFKELDGQGLVHRRDDGSWLLRGRPPETVTSLKRAERHERAVEASRHGPPARIQPLADRIVALRGRYERNLSLSAEALARSRAVRATSRRLLTESPRRPS